ncbi:hypothetical protein BLOT_000782 [Blomia tropicalis]|nr:hypothetical protein BLOT_000782 [Blomia tropicalis]
MVTTDLTTTETTGQWSVCSRFMLNLQSTTNAAASSDNTVLNLSFTQDYNIYFIQILQYTFSNCLTFLRDVAFLSILDSRKSISNSSVT